MGQSLQYHNDSWLNQVGGTNTLVNIYKRIERVIKASDSFLTKKELFSKFPNVPTDVLNLMLEEYQIENRIIYDKGKIVWTSADEPAVQKLLKDSIPIN